MNEVNKLRQRLKNLGKNTTEYRMSVSEAQELLKEFDDLSAKLVQKPQVTVTPTPEVGHDSGVVWDGGMF